MGETVTVTVTGIQTDVTPPVTISTVEQGEHHKKGETTYVLYQQEEDGQKVHHKIKIKGETVELHRSGDSQSRMVFEEGRSYVSPYETAGLHLMMEMRTQKVEIEEQEDRTRIRLEYELLLEGAHASDNKTEIVIQIFK